MYDGYLRVSQVAGRSGDSFISPDVQREQIERWAVANGVIVGEVFEELDESGARGDRPLLLEAIRRIETGESEGIIVARLDRFGRSLLDGLAAIERIVNANGSFVSAQDGLDLRTDTGRLILRVMLSMAEWELDRIRATWESARERAIDRGVYLGSTPPFGYKRGRDRRLEVDPDTGPLVAEIFRRHVRGETIPDLARWLEDIKVLTALENPGWTWKAVNTILRNRVYLGEVRSGRYLSRDAHPPLVERGLWQRAQDPRAFPIVQTRNPTLGGGLLRCAACRLALHSGSGRRRSGRVTPVYACGGHSAQGRCPAPAHVSGPLIEPFLEETFFGALSHRRRASIDDCAKETAAVEDAERALDSYRDNSRIHSVLGEEKYLEGLASRKRRLDMAMQGLAVKQKLAEPLGLPSASELEDLWPSMSIRQRRDAIAKVIDCVFVVKGWGAVRSRVFVCFCGTQPPDLPRLGARKRGPVKPIDSRQIDGAADLHRPPRWPVGRVRWKLSEFFVDRDVWPAVEEFLAAGYGPVYSQVLRRGGPEHWAKKMDIRPPDRRQGLRAWDEALVRESLQHLLRGKRSFPTRRELQDAGYGGLFSWMSTNGGVDRWAREFDLPRHRCGPRPRNAI